MFTLSYQSEQLSFTFSVTAVEKTEVVREPSLRSRLSR